MEIFFNFIKFIIAFVHDLTGGNQWLTTAIFGALAFASRRIPARLWAFTVRQLTVTLRVVDDSPSDKSETIDAILLYLKENMKGHLQRNFSVDDNADRLEDRIMTGMGTHYISIAGVRCVVSMMTKTVDKGEIRILVLKTMFWNRKKFKEMLREVYPKDYDIPFIYASSQDRFAGLTQIGSIPDAYGEQAQLIDDELYNRINDVMIRFMNDPDFYKKSQRPHKETFLFYGPAGTGKTHLARHLSSLHNVPVVLASRASLPNAIPKLGRFKKVILLIEDLVFPMVKDSDLPDATAEIDYSSVSRFLNILEGISPLINVLTIITTNHIDRIPPAVYRPGRVDNLIYFGYPSKQTVMKSLGFKPNDERYEYIDKLDLSEIPLANIVSLRNSKTLAEAKIIIEERDNYLKLSKATIVDQVN